MMQSVAVGSIQNLKKNFRRLGFAASAARMLPGVLMMISVVWVSGCAATSPFSTNTAPAITTQPASMTVTAGSIGTFAAAAAGTPTPSVQWMVSTNGGTSFATVAGATSTTLSVTTTASQNGNAYEAVAH